MPKFCCTNFKKIKGIKKYRSEVSILRYKYMRFVSELGIDRYWLIILFKRGIMVKYRKVVTPKFCFEARYWNVLIPEKVINTRHYSLYPKNCYVFNLKLETSSRISFLKSYRKRFIQQQNRNYLSLLFVNISFVEKLYINK